MGPKKSYSIEIEKEEEGNKDIHNGREDRKAKIVYLYVPGKIVKVYNDLRRMSSI
jgi:hypothetical protein